MACPSKYKGIPWNEYILDGYVRKYKAFEMRQNGAKFREIGKELNVSRVRARQMVIFCERYLFNGCATPAEAMAKFYNKSPQYRGFAPPISNSKTDLNKNVSS